MFDWERYLKYSEQLKTINLPPELSESNFRSIASRAYYSAYHVAEMVATKYGYQKPSTDSHRKLIEFWRNRQDKPSSVIATKLQISRDNRNKADYDDIVKGSIQKLADSTILLSTQIISLAKSIK